MEIRPVTPPYCDKDSNSSFKHLLSAIHLTSQPSSPPDLLQDHYYEEEVEDTLYTPSPKESFLITREDQKRQHADKSGNSSLIQPIHSVSHNNNRNKRRKSTPYKSPSIINNDDKHSVFQLNHMPINSSKCEEDSYDLRSRIICGQSLLSKLRKRVDDGRRITNHQQISENKHIKKEPVNVIIHLLPRYHSHSDSESSDNIEKDSSPAPLIYHDQQQEYKQQPTNNNTCYQQPSNHVYKTDNHNTPTKQTKKANTSNNNNISGRPPKLKGPCQSCKEESDKCMRKAYGWPITTSQTFYDKGKPFVYLCNKCGLRYNKSGGCVCRHCGWIFCKEEKRNALQHIAMMRLNRPFGQIDFDEEIENFVCNPKYWNCGRSWKVGWVMNNLDDEAATTTTTED